MNKFLGHLTSYSIFLGLLVIEVATETEGLRNARVDSPIEFFIWIYISSFIWDILKTIYFYGNKAFSRDWWLFYDIMMNLCFLISFMAALVSAIIMATKDDAFRNQPRTQWPWNDPTLVSEGFYAIGVVFAFFRILFFFKTSRLLGPLQVSLSRMIYHVMEVFVILATAVVAFAIGMFGLYNYYRDMRELDQGGEVVKEQPNTFTRYVHLVYTPFLIASASIQLQLLCLTGIFRYLKAHI